MDENLAEGYWRIRQAEALSIAEIAGDDEDREDLLRIAAIFEAMAPGEGSSSGNHAAYGMKSAARAPLSCSGR
jgi:hypothetical protein